MAKTISDLALDLGVFALDRELEDEADASAAPHSSRLKQPGGTPTQRILSTQTYIARLMKAAGRVKSDSQRGARSR
jgi:hypothetical protein